VIQQADFIKLEPEFLDYCKKNAIKSITAEAVSSGANCCRYVVPKVYGKTPEKHLDDYQVYHEQGLDIYVSKHLVLQDQITFKYSHFLGRHMMELVGYEIKRATGLL
jgi:hypothetical protein